VSRPMRTDRPMSEYEAAEWAIMQSVCQALIDTRALSHDHLSNALKKARDNFTEMGATNAAATIDMTISCIDPPRPSS
jgi:hypothetical protein